jgi:cytochrome c biogenesis protein CcmG, thiol:disulfide interchange protein DsbE
VKIAPGTLALAGVGLVVAGILAFGLATPASDAGGAAVGRTAPDFSATTLDTPPVTRTLADYRGQVVLLNVWATWCPPCLEEMPTIQKLHEAYADRGLRVVAISVDDAGEDDLIREFRAERGLTFEILHDSESAIFETYALPGVPMTFVIDREGIIRVSRFADDWFSDANRKFIEKLLDD